MLHIDRSRDVFQVVGEIGGERGKEDAGRGRLHSRLFVEPKSGRDSMAYT